MRDVIVAGLALLALWFVAVVVFKVVAFVFKLALIVGIVLLVAGFIRRGMGTRAARIRRPPPR